jgi:hypothetical protein
MGKHKTIGLANLIKKAFPNGTPQTRTYTVEGMGLVSEGNAPVIIRTFRLFWGVPCDEIGFSNFWIRFEGYANKMPWDGFAGSEGTYLPKARNIIHDAYLDSHKDYLALMMLDSDILFPPNLIDRLLEHNLPIVGGWYRDKKAPNHHPCVYDFLSEDDKGVASWNARPAPGTGLERVDGMGAGCWLMKREVAEALGRSPYDLNSGGEDMKISRKLMNLGIPLYVDWTLNCAHAGVGIT